MRCVAIAAALALAACATDPAPESPDEQLAELTRARERWARAGIQAYAVTLRRSCFCGGPRLVEVRVGEGRTIRTDLDTGQLVSADLAPWFPDVVAMFQLIEEEIRRPADRIDVTYDPTLGYAVALSVDRDRRLADEEYTYQVTAFRVLP